MEFTSTILALGIGGLVGAGAAVLAAGFRLESSLRRFRDSFERYIAPRRDSESITVADDFEILKSDLGALLSAVTQLRRALRIR